jgi:general secretion pathway protein G
MKLAFTMIELIFVIVIIGILVAVAVPRLSATRDDAITSRTISDITTAASELSSYAVAKGKVESNLSKMSNAIASLSTSGNAVVDNNKTAIIRYGGVNDCITMQIVSSTNYETLSLIYGNANGSSLCTSLQSAINPNQYSIKLRGQTVEY